MDENRLTLFQQVFIQLNRGLYRLARPLIFRGSAQRAHERVIRLLQWADNREWIQSLFDFVHTMSFTQHEFCVGGVTLDYPLILAAGFVKGTGFENEEEALAAVHRGENIIPGWRSMPRLVGLVEFGSFTRWPRVGNPGTVVWRDAYTRSTQNRVGLKNPGARAAAEFLSRHRDQLPERFGLNIAVSPGVADPQQEQREVLEAIEAFISRGIFPSWFTLNLSCPNTDDDPGCRQTESGTRHLCSAAVDSLRSAARPDIPLWVKISPDLSKAQYRLLMRVFHEVGVRAVVATNTLPAPAPENSAVTAGVGGGRLHQIASEVAGLLMQEKAAQGYNVDVIGCGGVEDGQTFRNYTSWGIQAVQYWSALIYRGPLAAAIIEAEV